MTTTLQCPPLLPAGVHIAPFLDRDDNVVLVAVNGAGGFIEAASVTFTTPFMPADPKSEKPTAAFTVKVGALLWAAPTGVHIAAWKPRDGQGRVFFAVDNMGRLVATMDVADLDDDCGVTTAVQALEALIDLAVAANADDDACDDGEGWKK